MNEETFIKMLMDNSVSDKAVFGALLRYLKTAELSGEPTDQAKEEAFSRFVAKQRPEVWKKFSDYVTEGHTYCCGPNAIQDDDSCLVKVYKTIKMWLWIVKFYLKFGE